MNANNARQVFTIAPIGRAYGPEAYNAAAIANLLQTSFEFVVDTTPVKFHAAKYRLQSGAIDLFRAVSDLKNTAPLRRRLSGELILLTSDPDSDVESATDYADHPLHEQCYFYHDTFSFRQEFGNHQHLCVATPADR